MKQSKKLDKYALEYLRPVLYDRLYDCCDSMRESDAIANRFNGACDDKYEIDKYVHAFHLNKYIETIMEVANENGNEVTKDNWQEFLNSRPTEFPESIVNYFDNE